MTPITPEWLYKIAAEVDKDPKRWTKDFAARDANGAPTLPKSEAACSWCLVGFGLRDSVANSQKWPLYHRAVAGNDSCKTPAEFVAWLREMAKELEYNAYVDAQVSNGLLP